MVSELNTNGVAIITLCYENTNNQKKLWADDNNNEKEEMRKTHTHIQRLNTISIFFLRFIPWQIQNSVLVIMAKQSDPKITY